MGGTSNGQEESHSHSLTIGSGSSYKLEGDTSMVVRDKPDQPTKPAMASMARSFNTPSYYDSRKKAEYNMGGTFESDRKIAKPSDTNSSGYESFTKQNRPATYKSAILESLSSREKILSEIKQVERSPTLPEKESKLFTSTITPDSIQYP